MVVHEICHEFKSYPDICDSLKKLDIAISFLKSVGGDIEMNLESFMSATLQIESPFPSQKVLNYNSSPPPFLCPRNQIFGGNFISVSVSLSVG